MAKKTHIIRSVFALIIGVFVAQAALLVIFVWPASRAAPNRVPLTVAGSPAIVSVLSQNLARATAGAFAITPSADRKSAVQLIMGRRAYGAIIIDQEGATLAIASGASPAIATALQNSLATALSETLPPGVQLQIRELSPNPAKDPHGAGIPSALIPLLLTSIVIGSAIALRVAKTSRRIWSLLISAIGAGLGATWLMQPVLGVLNGTFINNASVISLGVLTIAALTTGLVSAFALKGIPLAFFIVLILGFPLSGAFSARELIPSPWGAFGSWLPMGALNTALRSSSFFDFAGATTSMLTLGTWVIAGWSLLFVSKKH
jgi:hypothetical protein